MFEEVKINSLNREARIETVLTHEPFMSGKMPNDSGKDKIFIGQMTDKGTRAQINIFLDHLTTNTIFVNCHFRDIVIYGGNTSQDKFKLNFIDCDFDSLFILNTKRSSKGLEIISHKDNDCFVDLLRTSKTNNVRAISNYKITTFVLEYASLFLISGLSFSNCDFNYIHVTGTDPEKLVLDSIFFFECKFFMIDGFNVVKFGQQIEFTNPTFEDISENTHSTFRHMKHNFESLSNDFLSNMFAGFELKSKFNSSEFSEGRTEYTLNWMYNNLNNFGLDPYRPFMWIAILTVSFTALIELCYQSLFSNLEVTFNNSVLILLSPLRVFARNNNLMFDKCHDINSTFQMLILGVMSLMWFFLVVGIRKRFKIT